MVIYRSERKKILRSQFDLLKFLKVVLEESKTLNEMVDENSNMDVVNKTFQKIYLSPSDQEKS